MLYVTAGQLDIVRINKFDCSSPAVSTRKKPVKSVVSGLFALPEYTLKYTLLLFCGQIWGHRLIYVGCGAFIVAAFFMAVYALCVHAL